MPKRPESSAANPNLRAKHIGEQVGLSGSAAAFWAEWRTFGNREGLVIAAIARKFCLETHVFSEIVVKRPTASVQAIRVCICLSRIEANLAVKHSYFRFRIILGKRSQTK